jgi:RES domain-containing protein
VAWRLDSAQYATTWDSGEGAFLYGGRWNSRGVRAVYCSVDPSTAILEVAVHTGFEALDRTPHVLTALTITHLSRVQVFENVPEPLWLTPGIPSAAQQGYGDALLARHAFVVIPSAVSRNSWNLIFVAATVTGAYTFRSQERFVLDPRLHHAPEVGPAKREVAAREPSSLPVLGQPV